MTPTERPRCLGLALVGVPSSQGGPSDGRHVYEKFDQGEGLGNVRPQPLEQDAKHLLARCTVSGAGEGEAVPRYQENDAQKLAKA